MALQVHPSLPRLSLFKLTPQNRLQLDADQIKEMDAGIKD